MDISDLLMAQYQEGGRGPDAFDCFGLFAELCRRRGLYIPNQPSPESLSAREAEIYDVAENEWIRLQHPEEGCAVLLRIGGWVSHIGMVLEGGRFIHASKHTGITVARLDDVQWIERNAGFYRHVGEAK
jgi:cell wall-associated NlpC family hydrolase